MNVNAHAALVNAAASGDDEALSLLVRVYHDRVYRFGVRVCHDEFDADDAVQEAFIKLSARPDVLRDPSALSWLMTVVRNACRRLLRPFARQRALSERLDGHEGDTPVVNPEQALQRFEIVREVHSAIARLELPYREVLVLRDLEGLSGTQACAALGLEPATMKTRLHRARAKLREELLRRRASAADREAS